MVNVVDNNRAKDGRLTVVLGLLFALLLFDLAKGYHTSFSAPKQDNGMCRQLHYLPPDSLALNGCSSAKEGRETVSARCSPFLFTAMPINDADKDMLMTIDGIGPALADDILAYRHRFGPFADSTDLQNLPGIGPKREKKFAAVFTFTEK